MFVTCGLRDESMIAYCVLRAAICGLGLGVVDERCGRRGNVSAVCRRDGVEVVGRLTDRRKGREGWKIFRVGLRIRDRRTLPAEHYGNFVCRDAMFGRSDVVRAYR